MALGKVEVKGSRSYGFVDLLIILVLAALLAGLVYIHPLTGPTPPAPLPPVFEAGRLPLDCLLSLARNAAATFLSLILTFVLGLLAAKSRRVERVLVPAADLLQSIPILAFLPGLVLALAGLFPASRAGLEASCILLAVFGQCWNMILAFYAAVKGIPQNLRDAAVAAGFTPWRRFKKLELPYAAVPLVWNAMLSMSAGWLAITAAEAFMLDGQDFRLPGLGSAMALAARQPGARGMLACLAATALTLLAVDQLFWRPLVAWTSRYRVDDAAAGETPPSWFLGVLQRSPVVRLLAQAAGLGAGAVAYGPAVPSRPPRPKAGPFTASLVRDRLLNLAGLAVLVVLGLVGWRLLSLFERVSLVRWAVLAGEAVLTFGRLLGAGLLAALVAVPLGVVIGRRPRIARPAQVLAQLASAFPAPILLPAVAALLAALGLDFEVACVLLISAGIFSILFYHVVTAASLIPLDQTDAWLAYGRPRGWFHWSRFLLPAVFPGLVSGLNSMAAAAWNVAIIAEVIPLHGRLIGVEHGLGAALRGAAEAGDLPLMIAAVFIFCCAVAALNRVLWLPLSDLAAKYSS